VQPLCRGKAISMTYGVCVCVYICVFVDLGIYHAMHLHHIVICGLPASTIFFHIISSVAKFSKTNVTEYKMCVEYRKIRKN
jgi:hypothetical protein